MNVEMNISTEGVGRGREDNIIKATYTVKTTGKPEY
jgi:hypothetical protein